MTELEQYNIWIHYMTTRIAMKHNFEIVNRKSLRLPNLPDWHGWGEPDRIVHDIGFFKLWKNLTFVSFEDFKNNQNADDSNSLKYWMKRV